MEDRLAPASHLVTLLTDTTASASPGELRTEINNAAAGDTINFQSGLTGTIKLTAALGALALSKNLTITGPGATTLSISGQNAIEVFSVASGVTDIISGLAISYGKAANGGGIENRGNVTISNSTLSSNSTTGNGGAIENRGTLSLQNSTITGNSSTSNGGGIYNIGTLTIQGTTFSSNSGGTLGGGISNVNGMVTLTSSTLTGNVALEGGAVYSKGSTAKLTVLNSTLCANFATYYGAGIYSGPSSTATLTNTTINANRTLSNFRGFGGGIAIGAAAQVTLVNTIVAGNTNRSSGTALPDDIAGGANVVTANSFNNLIGTGGAAGLVNGTNAN